MEISKLLNLDEEALRDKLLWVDHRDDEESIVIWISEYLGLESTFFPIWRDDELYVSYNGKIDKIPLSMSRYDRYVAISSIAYLLKEKYETWLLRDCLDSDTHGMAIVPIVNSDIANNKKIEDRFDKLVLGYDYFSGISVPYIGNLDNNPNFEKEVSELNIYKEAFLKELQETDEFKGAINDFKQGLDSLQAKKKRPFLRFVCVFFGIFITLRLVRYFLG